VRARGWSRVLVVVMVVSSVVASAGLPGGSPVPLGPVSAAAAAAPMTAFIVIGQADYKTPSVAVAAGGTVTVQNQATIKHTVTADIDGSDGRPLFKVEVPAGETRSFGIPASMANGDYAFHCTIHPIMRGTLRVGTGGTVPIPRPAFEQPLLIPKVLTDAKLRIPMKPAQVQVFPAGPSTKMWTYGGTYPGPTIRRPAGHDTKITFANRLPEDAGSMSVHFHGDHHAAKHDGQPTTELVRRGHERTYDFPLTDRGRPERAAFDWYHDHRMNHTTRNNWQGLQGMFLITDDRSKKLGLPSGKYDVPIMVSERSFTDDHQLTQPFPLHAGMMLTGPDAPPNDATIGETVLANGRFAPYLKVSTHRYRLRLLNSSAFTSYAFHLSDGRPFIQVGTGNGLLPRSVVRSDIVLGPAQRADVVVDFHGALNDRIVLESIPTDKGPGTPAKSIMQFRVNQRAADDTRVPDALLPAPRMDLPRKIAKTWKVGLGGDPDTGSFWTINGKPFNPDRVDFRVPLGATQKWKLVNNTEMTHFIHLHEEEWRTIKRNGHRPPAWERGTEDTWRLDPGDSVVVAARFTDYTGRFMLHCHMLDHEDHGLMATFKVYRPTKSGTSSATSAKVVSSPLIRSVLAADGPAEAMTADDLMCRTRRRTRAS
jgi:spore coat protein A, manganese oxidase